MSGTESSKSMVERKVPFCFSQGPSQIALNVAVFFLPRCAERFTIINKDIFDVNKFSLYVLFYPSRYELPDNYQNISVTRARICRNFVNGISSVLKTDLGSRLFLEQYFCMAAKFCNNIPPL